MLKTNLLNTIIIIFTLVLGLAGLIFIMVSAFNNNAPGWVLVAGLACISVGNLINFIRIEKNKKKEGQ